MRIDRFTQKMQEALQSAQDLASQYNHQEVGNEHFLVALLQQPDGIARPLLDQLQVPVDQLQQELQIQLEQRPKVMGAAVDLRIGYNLRAVIDAAEREMARLKDEFTSAEHYLLALANSDLPTARLFQDYGVTHPKLLQALQQIRGSQRVMDQNPEVKYQTL